MNNNMASIPQRISVISSISSWNSLIRGSVNRNDARKALLLFREMKENGFEPNNLTFPFIAKACAKLSNLKNSQIIHSHVVKSPHQFDVYVQTAMVDMYVKCGDTDFAYRVFEKMPERDTASWNVMLSGLSQMDRVLSLFRDMIFTRTQPDSVTVMVLTSSISYTKNLHLLKAVHSLGFRIGVNADVSVANTWIAAYGKCNDLDSSRTVFDGIDIGVRTVISWNSMIAACSSCSSSEKFGNAFDSYKSMIRHGFCPDISTIVSVLSSFVQPEALYQGRLMHSHAIHFGCDQDIAVINTFISMYSKCGDIDSARFIFDCMYMYSRRTCVSWTAMISGYAEKGDIDEAVALFDAMQTTGEKPDLVTVLSLISGCGRTGSVELGRWIDDYANVNMFKNDIVIRNALIDMYSKCGSIDDAREVFNATADKTVVSWTSMITGCGLNGEFVEALSYFRRMIELGFKPNRVTFLAILQACNHGGFLDEGWDCFDMIVSPGLDHYSCMADLLGRRGKIKEAVEFVTDMPMKPDAGVWGGLLNACKIYGDVDTAEYVVNRLFELEPDVAAPYVEMANVYASAGKWDRVAKIRSMMKSNKVRKYPGESVVRVNGEAHAFTVEARDHPVAEVIYWTLDCLKVIMDGGYERDLEVTMEYS